MNPAPLPWTRANDDFVKTDDGDDLIDILIPSSVLPQRGVSVSTAGAS
jgi:hypothetical protein